MSPDMTVGDAIAYIQWASTMLPKAQPFVVHDGNRRAVQQSAMWLFRLPGYDGDVRRGLEFRGHKGTGKTHLMRCLSYLLTPQGSRGRFDSGFPVIKCDDIVQEFNNSGSYKLKGEKGEYETRATGGDQVIIKYASMERICYDDLGDERPGKYFGETVNVMERILGKRGDLMSASPLLTMFTTNLDKDAIDLRYGERVADRRLLMIRPLVIEPDPKAAPFREKAEVLDWRKEAVNREPAENQVSAEKVQEFTAKLDEQKNIRRKEHMAEQELKKKAYLDDLERRLRSPLMKADTLLKKYFVEVMPEARDMIERSFDSRSPIPLKQLIKEREDAKKAL